MAGRTLMQCSGSNTFAPSQSQEQETATSSFAKLLKACGSSQDLSQGRQVHRRIGHSEHRENIFLQNLTMEMYGKCGSPEEARKVFDSICNRNIFSWNIMMSAYAQNRHIAEARGIFDFMPEKDTVSWNTIVSAYAQFGHMEEANALFDQMPKRTPIAWNTMTAAYVHYGQLNEAREMFERMPNPSAISWNIMLMAYAQNGYLKEAEQVFSNMKEKDVASWNAMIGAYAENGRLDSAWGIFKSMPERDIISWNSMITANAQNGELDQARKVFDKMPKRNLVSWNAIITAYTESERCKDVISLLGLMDLEGLEPNDITVVSVFTVCSTTGALSEGRLVHQSLAHKRCLSNVVVGTALISMYTNCNSVDDGWSFFEQMSNRNVVTWNVMITGYVHNGRNREAFMLYGIMNLEGMTPDEVTFVGALDACSGFGGLAQGRILHEIVRHTEHVRNVVVGTALVNMYARCGSPDVAGEVFSTMPVRNDVTWNSMIAVHAQYGHGNVALRFFQLMHLEGEEPSDITFINLLSAFSHGAGVVNSAAFECFMSILGDYRDLLRLDHYICMIDVVGRAGWLQDAEDLIRVMPFEPSAVCWMTLLGACTLHGDSHRGTIAAENVLKLDPANPAPYVLLSSIFAKKSTVTQEPEERVSHLVT